MPPSRFASGTGCNLNALSHLHFNGASATPTSWNNTSIVVPVPSGAASGSVVVTVAGHTSNGASFTVTTPPSVTGGRVYTMTGSCTLSSFDEATGAPVLSDTLPCSGFTGAGEVKLVDSSRVMNLITNYTDPEQLVAPMGEIREAIRQKNKERRYLQAFRNKNYEFLQRYNSIKHRLKDELDRRKKKTLG